jgi:N-acetyl sugar amidotransferase
MPDTRPGLRLDSRGICNACNWKDVKANIHWEKREQELMQIAQWARDHSQSSWDCVLGVSGGKDSTWQAFYVRDVLKLNPLLVQFVSSDSTPLGRYNIENLISHGFDHISIQPDPMTAQYLSRESFFRYGNIIKYAELALFSIPFRTAIQYDIPLVFFGENPSLEAGDCNEGEGWDATTIRNNNTLGGAAYEIWLDDYISEKNLIQYRFPTEKEFSSWGGKGVFMGYYLNWSGWENARFAISKGMKCIDDTYRNIGLPYTYNSLDSDNGGILNAMLKHLKFGFGNTTELTSYDTRYGRISRSEAALIIRELDGKCHQKYMDAYCSWVGITVEQFRNHTETLRGTMWVKTPSGWELENPLWEQITLPEKKMESILQKIQPENQ